MVRSLRCICPLQEFSTDMCVHCRNDPRSPSRSSIPKEQKSSSSAHQLTECQLKSLGTRTRTLRSASLYACFYHQRFRSSADVCYHTQFFPNDKMENGLFKHRLSQTGSTHYTPAHALTRQLRMSGLTLSKLTSSMMITAGNGDQKMNIGLNLKFEAKSLKVLGYSRKGDGGWEFSQKAIDLIEEYKTKFPEVAGALEQRRGGALRVASSCTESHESY